MISTKFLRFLHTTQSCWNASNKSLLAKLRKKTGYSFSNCKKALEINNNDLEKAETWLKAEAQALGWSKAAKLENRPTAQGLVALSLEGSNAAILEVNCETDFVARNKNFHAITELAVKSCLRFTNSQPLSDPLTKIALDSDNLKELLSEEDKILSDHVALAIGNLGENISLRRAICFRASPDVKLAGYTHPAPVGESKILFGKYGALIAFRESMPASDEKFPLHQLGKQLCQHVVGMNPRKIGVMGEDNPAENTDDEQCMIHQEYLLDPSQTVGQILSETGITILDFIRLECGEEVAVADQLGTDTTVSVASN